MKNCSLCIFLLCTLPALATISQRQTPVSQFNSGASSTCFNAFGSTPTQGDLFVVWTYWSTGGSQNHLTAKVTDSATFNNSFVSAVGPTLQVGSNTAAQIFYVANLNSPGTGSDTLTVTYYLNGVQTNATTSGCVFVEYQGADPNYPLDSTSAGYSYSPGNLLDSGTAAPANSNLLVFAGGTIDTGTAVAGSNFTAIQSHLGSITEQNTNPITGNNVLQRATAGLLATGSGHWLMQMAVFRDASWTVAGGWSSVRAAQVRNADQFPGADASYKVNACIADVLAAGGGTCDARGLGGVQAGLTQEIDVGNGTLGVDLILPSNATWRWNPAVNNGTICGIKVFNAGAVYTNGDSGAGSRTVVTVTNSMAQMRALLCTNSASNGYERMRGIYASNLSYNGQGATMAKGDIDIENVGDASSFDDLSCADDTPGNKCFYVSGLSFQSRISHCTANSPDNANVLMHALPMLIGDTNFTTDAGIIDGCTFNRPPSGSPNIKITGFVDGLTIIQPYMEGNPADASATLGLIDIASSAYNITIVGGTAVSFATTATRPAISTASTRTSVTGMQAIGFVPLLPGAYAGGILDSEYGINVPEKLLCGTSCGNLAAIPTYDSGSNAAMRFAAVDLTLLNNVQSGTLYTVLPNASDVASGQYKLSWNAKVTSAATNSTLGSMTVKYTDPDGVLQSITAAATDTSGGIETTDSGNTTTTVMIGVPLLLNCAVNLPITYSFGYTSSPSGSMKYNLHIQLEAMPH